MPFDQARKISYWTWIFFFNHLSSDVCGLFGRPRRPHPRHRESRGPIPIGFCGKPGYRLTRKGLGGPIAPFHGGVNLRSFCAFLGENNHRAGRNSRRDRRLEIGKTRSRRKSASFSGLGRKTSPENGQKSEFSELLKNGSSSEAKVLKRYGRLLAAPAAFRERVEFRANRLVGLHTHEGVGDRTERPFFGPKSGGWGGVSGCHQSSTCRRYYRGVVSLEFLDLEIFRGQKFFIP